MSHIIVDEARTQVAPTLEGPIQPPRRIEVKLWIFSSNELRRISSDGLGVRLDPDYKKELKSKDDLVR
ncbi:hypothetical protein CRG98_034816 [Punica granatum]|uniref:Uncharacterized protein n=1 Tax=Punica granatum TaxID=22663 RepID=A0A2I0ILI2_PUNGR|nr:hypothetical protein CRG98_034816 [Punica granatum]